MTRFTYHEYADRLQRYLITRLPLDASIAILGHNLGPCWEFVIRLRTRPQRSRPVHFHVANRPYLNGQRCEADIAEDAGHIARLLRVSLGLEHPNPSSAFERLYAAPKPPGRKSDIRRDCRFYSSNTGLKCAVHPELDCCECPSFEPR